MDDMIAAIYPTIRDLAVKISGSCYLTMADKSGRIGSLQANWITNRSPHQLIHLSYRLIIDTEGIQFHRILSSNLWRIEKQNIQWTDPDLLEKITNFMTPPHHITPNTYFDHA